MTVLTRVPASLIPPSLLAALVLAPTAGAAVPPKDASGAYLPKTGVDLIDAVAAAKAASPTPAVIKLDGAAGDGDNANGTPSYVVPSAITLGTNDHITIQSLSVDPTAVPDISSAEGDGRLLLDLTGAGSTVRGITFTGPTSATDPATVLVKLGGNATLGSASSGGAVGVTSSGATPVETNGNANAMIDVTVANPGGTGPSVHARGGLTMSTTKGQDGAILGGQPSIDVDGTASAATQDVTINGISVLQPGGTGLAVRGGTGSVAVHVRSARFTSLGGSSAAVTIGGASGASGSVSVDVRNSNVTAPADTDGTAVQVSPGSGTTASQVSLVGLYTTGFKAALACGASGAKPALVTIDAIYREGTVAPSSNACTVNETGRVTGPPKISGDTSYPQWGSSLIDKTPSAAGSTADTLGAPRNSAGPNTPAGTPTDIGAFEYQYSAPKVTATSVVEDDQGHVTFAAMATDNDDAIDPDTGDITSATSFAWHLPDGSTVKGDTASWKYSAGNPGPITVTATDVSGMTTTVPVTPAPDVSGIVIVPTPTPTPTATPAPVATPTPAPAGGAMPTKSPTPTPVITPGGGGTATVTTQKGVLASFQLVNSRISKSAKKASGLGAPSSGEAGLKVTLPVATKLTFVARTQKGTKYGAISGARFTVEAKAGAVALRISSVIGKAKLKPGLYRLTLLAVPATGAADRRDFSLRIK